MRMTELEQHHSSTPTRTPDEDRWIVWLHGLMTTIYFSNQEDPCRSSSLILEVIHSLTNQIQIPGDPHLTGPVVDQKALSKVAKTSSLDYDFCRTSIEALFPKRHLRSSLELNAAFVSLPVVVYVITITMSQSIKTSVHQSVCTH